MNGVRCAPMLGRTLLIGILGCMVGCSSVSDPEPQGPVGQPDGGAVIPPRPAVASMYVHTADTLYIVDPQDFELTLVGTFDNGDSLTDLAVATDGRVFGISDSALYAVDRSTAKATYIADVPGLTNVGLTFLPSGSLLATDKQGGVRAVDPATGAVVEVGKFGNGYGTAGDLVAVADGTMYAIGEEEDSANDDPDVLLRVNTSSGDATYVGGIGYGNVWGSAFANGNVYAFTNSGSIIEIDPITGAGTLVKQHDEAFWGAAVTPLVTVE